MVMPNQPQSPFAAMGAAMVQQDRAAFFQNAVLYYARAGLTAEQAATEADKLLAAFDVRDVSPSKLMFGLPKEQP